MKIGLQPKAGMWVPISLVCDGNLSTVLQSPHCKGGMVFAKRSRKKKLGPNQIFSSVAPPVFKCLCATNPQDENRGLGLHDLIGTGLCEDEKKSFGSNHKIRWVETYLGIGIWHLTVKLDSSDGLRIRALVTHTTKYLHFQQEPSLHMSLSSIVALSTIEMFRATFYTMC